VCLHARAAASQLVADRLQKAYFAGHAILMRDTESRIAEWEREIGRLIAGFNDCVASLPTASTDEARLEGPGPIAADVIQTASLAAADAEASSLVARAKLQAAVWSPEDGAAWRMAAALLLAPTG
jgi:hypothetical protein